MPEDKPLKFEDEDDFRNWIDRMLWMAKNVPEFQDSQRARQRKQLEMARSAKWWPNFVYGCLHDEDDEDWDENGVDERVGTCAICGENLGYLMNGDLNEDEDVGSPFRFKPHYRYDEEAKQELPIPDTGCNPWPIIDDEESRCCQECDITEVLPARFAMDDKASHH